MYCRAYFFLDGLEACKLLLATGFSGSTIPSSAPLSDIVTFISLYADSLYDVMDNSSGHHLFRLLFLMLRHLGFLMPSAEQQKSHLRKSVFLTVDREFVPLHVCDERCPMKLRRVDNGLLHGILLGESS